MEYTRNISFYFGEKAPGINVELIQKYVANDLQSIGNNFTQAMRSKSFSPNNNNNNNNNELPRYQARHATCGFVRHFRVRQPCQGDPSAQPHDRLVANPIFVVQGGATSSAGMSTYPDRGRIRAPATFEAGLDSILDGCPF